MCWLWIMPLVIKMKVWLAHAYVKWWEHKLPLLLQVEWSKNLYLFFWLLDMSFNSWILWTTSCFLPGIPFNFQGMIFLRPKKNLCQRTKTSFCRFVPKIAWQHEIWGCKRKNYHPLYFITVIILLHLSIWYHARHWSTKQHTHYEVTFAVKQQSTHFCSLLVARFPLWSQLV